MTKQTLNQLLLLLATIVWGSSFFLVKNLVACVDPFVLVAYRFLSAAFILLVIMLFLKKRVLEGILEGLLLGLTIWLVVVLQALGMVYTSASNSGFITAMFVVFVPLLSVIFFKGKISLGAVPALLLNVCGLWFLTEGLKSINPGDYLTLLAALSSAFHIIFIDRFSGKKLDPLTMCFHQFFFAGALSLLSALILGRPMVIGGAGNLLSLAYLVALPTVFSFLVQIYSQRYVDAFKASLIYTLEPVFAAALAWTIGGERIVPLKAFGGGLVFIGLIVFELGRKKEVRK